MGQDLEESDDEVPIHDKKFHSIGWYLGFGIILLILLCAVMGGTQGVLFLLFLPSLVAVKYSALYLLLVALLFIISIIGVLKSDKNDNINLFYGSAFLFCISIFGGIFYFVAPFIFWFFTRD